MKDQDKISIIKNLRFLTNSQTEWDERYGHLKKDHKAAMELVRKECAANYPYVDIDDFLESYMHFDNAPLRTSLTGSRISPKQWNMRDEDTFVSVMRHLVLRNQSPYPRVGRRDILELLEQEDPAITFLVYFHPDGHTPILPPPGSRPGDNKEDLSLYLGSIAEALRRIHNAHSYFEEPPLLSVMMSLFNAINTSGNGKRMVRMDIINLVSAVLNNIINNSTSEALHYANIAALENKVDIGLRTDVFWRSNTNQIWQVEGSDGSYILTRYEKVNGKRTYAKFILSVYRGEDSQIVGCLESPDLVKDTLYGEVSPNASYVTLNMTDEEGARLLSLSDGTVHSPVKIKFYQMSKSTKEPSKLLRCSELHIMTDKERETDCDALQNITDGLYNVCATTCDLPTRPQEVLMSSPYIYLSCETEDMSIPAKGCEESGSMEHVGMRIKSWIRIPRWMEYKSRLGDTTDLTDITEHDRPSWRRFRGADDKMVEVVYFALHSIAIDVTLSMHPQDGCELPHGIVVVRSPYSTILPSDVTYVRVKGAVARADANSYKADVTYEYSRWDEDTNRECVVEEDIVSVPEALPY